MELKKKKYRVTKRQKTLMRKDEVGDKVRSYRLSGHEKVREKQLM